MSSEQHIVLEAEELAGFDQALNPDDEYFDYDIAVAQMLLAETLSLNTFHWKRDWTKEAREGYCLFCNPGDVFMWGGSGGEPVLYDDLKEYYRYWVKDPRFGPAIWVVIRNREMPQAQMADAIREAGTWDLDALQKEHNLRPNSSNGYWGIRAKLSKAAYDSWQTPATSWEWQESVKWRAYVEANPEESAAIESRIRAEQRVWDIENGYIETLDIPTEPC